MANRPPVRLLLLGIRGRLLVWKDGRRTAEFFDSPASAAVSQHCGRRAIKREILVVPFRLTIAMSSGWFQPTPRLVALLALHQSLDFGKNGMCPRDLALCIIHSRHLPSVLVRPRPQTIQSSSIDSMARWEPRPPRSFRDWRKNRRLLGHDHDAPAGDGGIAPSTPPTPQCGGLSQREPIKWHVPRYHALANPGKLSFLRRLLPTTNSSSRALHQI